MFDKRTLLPADIATHNHIPPHNTTAGPDTSAFDYRLQVYQTLITHKPLPPFPLISPNLPRGPPPQPLPQFPPSPSD